MNKNVQLALKANCAKAWERWLKSPKRKLKRKAGWPVERTVKNG